MKEKIVKIYYLISPNEPDHIRYVGQTSKKLLTTRLQEHITASLRSDRNAPVNKWIRELVVKPSIVLIEEIKNNQCVIDETERKWITYYRQTFPDLLNVKSGGNTHSGYKGFRHTEQWKEEHSGINSPGYGKIPWNKGLTKETDERLVIMAKNLSNKIKGRKLSKEHIEKIRQRGKNNKHCLGHKCTEDAKRKLSVINTGKKYPNRKPSLVKLNN
jgi:hypothetical protein